MKTNNKVRALFQASMVLVVFIAIFVRCDEKLLNEKSLSSPSSDQVLSSKAGFESFVTTMYADARNEFFMSDNWQVPWMYSVGTDVAVMADQTLPLFVNYATQLTSTNSMVVDYMWNWAYGAIAKTNSIIVAGNSSDLSIWNSEAERNAIIAEAKFFRAYYHNVLAILYGGVPIADTVYSEPKVNFVRATRKEVWEFAKKDLVYASKWLPTTMAKSAEGRVVKAAADHLLSEVYISLGEYDNAITSASDVINSGLYKLMDARFGSESISLGDVYSDLFKDNNQNRSSGNMESLYVIQVEDGVTGGVPGAGGNNWLRGWGPRYFGLKDPKGATGMVICDSMGRGPGWIRPSNYFYYDIWKGDLKNDMRNSRFNIRRSFVYNNPASTYYGKLVEKRTAFLDTMYYLYPTIRKIEGKVGKTTNNTYGKTYKDYARYRLAETYLLRAEAYIRKGSSFYANAAADINVVRARVNAKQISAADVSIDFLLDERARELIVEEPRRLTLMRMGKLVERVKKYCMNPTAVSSVRDCNELYPIPQTAIDANFGAVLEQNPGY